VTLARLGVVAIGRNEGKRLARCFDSVPDGIGRVVYVDSGSTDDSVEQARQRAIEVVLLDMSIPFTAARARNAGFNRLLSLDPGLEFVQFVDGDCELLPGWWKSALEHMASDPRIAVVCGRLRERFRNATLYNRICDLEWDTPEGETDASGGIAMMRTKAFREVGGFNDALIAGEEPDLCFRLRAGGNRILRIAVDMALHDAAMSRFSQWWRRTQRGGHAYAELEALHPGMCTHKNRSIALWAGAFPVTALATAAFTSGLGLLLFLAYPLQWARVTVRRAAMKDGWLDAALYGASCVLGKFPELVGIVKYRMNRLRGRRSALIEYK